MWRKFALSLILVSAVVAVASEPCGPPPYWSYSATATNGPRHWASLKESWAVCSTGTAQSPVDLPVNPVVRPPEINIHYGALQPTPATKITFENTGHYPKVLNDNGENYVTVDNHHYTLEQFHIHNPSEHTVNGGRHRAEIHFVNKDADGNGVVVAVFVDVAKRNNTQIGYVLSGTPNACGFERTERYPVNALSLLPASKHYRAYEGSLTTPGCDQGVHFYVLKTPIYASNTQITRLRQRFGESKRPEQRLNGRVVYTDAPN